MIQITKINVESFDLDFLDVSWSLADTSERLARYSIYVQKSVDGSEGPWREVAGPLPGNHTTFRDNDVNQFHNWRQYFYRLRIVDQETSLEYVSAAYSQVSAPDLIAIELKRRFELVLQEFAGRKVLLFPAITSGFRCPSCYVTSPQGFSIGRQTTQNCQTCFDTTFVGGFASPIVCYIQIDPAVRGIQRNDTQEQDRQDSTARMSGYPIVKPRDVIVEAENIRWEIQSMVPTEKSRSIVSQSVTLHRIPSSDIRYKIPVNWNESSFSPKREFVRAMDFDPGTTF